jgi:hypothetical protein
MFKVESRWSSHKDEPLGFEKERDFFLLLS